MRDRQSLRNIDTHHTILVVDDERTTLAIVGRLFEQHGYQTVLASNGVEALEALKRSPIDLVLLDVMMPEMDGWEVLASIRSQYNEFQLPIVMFTATEDRHEIVRMFKAGANDYVSKPFDLEITLARVETHLRLKKAQNQVRLSEERYSLAARATNDGLWDWELTSNLVYYSSRWSKLVGLPEREFTGPTEFWFDRVHHDDQEHLASILIKLQRGKLTQFDTEFRILHEDGNFRWVICRGITVKNADGETTRIAGSITDITGGKVADVLTGLPNRLLFKERMARCLSDVVQEPAKRCAVIYLDLDNFKFINDTFGHDAGDQVLVASSKRLERVISKSGLEAVAARFGGDEFGVLIEEFDSPEQLYNCAKNIHQAMVEPIRVEGGREVFTQASLGIAMASCDTTSPDELLSQADIAMYDAKTQGKGRTSTFDQSMQARFKARLELETELRKAIHKKSFYLEYQPIFDIAINEIVGFEALLRWEHPALGMISPYEFIFLAEELNVIQNLGQWMIYEVCHQIAAWKILLANSPNIFISINVSSKQFAQPDFFEQLLNAVQEAEVDCSAIKLEITESVIMKNMAQAADLIRRLQGYGFRVAIDDFGTGFSSLAYLHQLPLDILKVDKSFIERIEDPVSGAPIVNTILTLASNLKLAAIAEGVETQQQLDELRRLGCRYAQGYLLSRPLSGQAATRLLTNVEATMKVSSERASRIFRTNVQSIVASMFMGKDSDKCSKASVIK